MTNGSTEAATTHPGARPGFTVADGHSPIEAMYDAGLTDGLPVVPPTQALVGAMLDGGPWAADEVLLHEPTRGLDVTAYQAAVSAVMAGALPDYFPTIGSALRAMSEPAFFLHGPTTSTGGAAIMIIVSGPEAARIGVHGRENLFGPGFRANATIGRTIRLVQMHCLSAIPGQLDKSTQGWPGKLSICFTEHIEASPWEPIHVSLGHEATESTVTVWASEAPHNVCTHGTSDPTELLGAFAGTLAGLGSFSPGRSVVVFAPEHAAKLDGWSRQDVQSHLFEHATCDLATLKRAGKIEHDPTATPDWSGQWRPQGDRTIAPGDDQILVRRGWRPADILLLVGGGAAGGHSAFFPSWSRTRSVPFVTEVIPT